MLHDDHYAWTVSQGAAGQKRRDPVASAYAGVDVDCELIYEAKRPPRYRGAMPSAADASAALRAAAVEICPVCHFALPDGWRQGHAVCIAMAGAPGTGKSTYLAVLIKQLQLLCENAWRVDGAGDPGLRRGVRAPLRGTALSTARLDPVNADDAEPSAAPA